MRWLIQPFIAQPAALLFNKMKAWCVPALSSTPYKYFKYLVWASESRLKFSHITLIAYVFVGVLKRRTILVYKYPE